jgi:hypothetical protein
MMPFGVGMGPKIEEEEKNDEAHEGSTYDFSEMNFLDRSLQMPMLPFGVGMGPKIEEEEKDDEACEELSDDMYMSVSDISDAGDSSPLPSSTDSSPLPSRRKFAKQLTCSSGGMNNPIEKCLEMNSIAEDDDVSIFDCTVGKPPNPPVYGRPTFGQTSGSCLSSLAMRYKTFDERRTYHLALQVCLSFQILNLFLSRSSDFCILQIRSKVIIY